MPSCSSTPGAILDITLIANVQSLSHSDFYLSCIMGERDVSYLQIERENKIVMTHPKTGFQNYRNRSNHVQARGFSMADLVGILYCLGRTPTEQAQVVYVHNSHNGERLGGHMGATCSVHHNSSASRHGGGILVTHRLCLGSASSHGVDKGGMFSWRRVAEAHGSGQQHGQTAGLGSVPRNRARSKRKSGSLGGGGGVWKSLTRMGGSPLELCQPHAPPSRAHREEVVLECTSSSPPGACRAQCHSSTARAHTAKGSAGLLPSTPILCHMASGRDSTWGRTVPR